MRNVDEQQNIRLTEPGTYPFTLIVGRKMTMFQDDHTIRDNKSVGANRQQDQTVLAQMEMNPDDVTLLGLQDGAEVRVSNEIGSVLVSIRRSSRLARGNLFVQVTDPSAVLVNLLTSDEKEASIRDSDSPLAKRAFMYVSVRIDSTNQAKPKSAASNGTRAAEQDGSED